MSSEIIDEKVEDLVKKAIKETLAKRKGAIETITTRIEPLKEEPKEVKDITVTKKTLGANQIWVSDIVGRVKDDFPVTQYMLEDWNERMVPFIPKINDNYVIQPDLAVSILRAWELNDKTLMYGPTGAGKSSLVEQLCAITRRPFIRINSTGDMDSSMVFGQLTASDGSTVWQDGPVTEAVKYGAVFAWDEWDVTPPEIAMGLQWLLEDEGKLYLKEKPGSSEEKFLTPEERFRLVAIGNTQGQGDDTGSHAGTNVQNTATLDRFGTTVYVPYLDVKHEESILTKKYGSVLSEGLISKIVQFGNLIRQAYTSNQLTLTMSPRSLLSISNKVSFGCSLDQAIALVYTNKLSGTNQKVAKELYRKVFGSK